MDLAPGELIFTEALEYDMGGFVLQSDDGVVYFTAPSTSGISLFTLDSGPTSRAARRYSFAVGAALRQRRSINNRAIFLADPQGRVSGFLPVLSR